MSGAGFRAGTGGVDIDGRLLLRRGFDVSLFVIDGEELTLLNGEQELARFEAVYLR